MTTLKTPFAIAKETMYAADKYEHNAYRVSTAIQSLINDFRIDANPWNLDVAQFLIHLYSDTTQYINASKIKDAYEVYNKSKTGGYNN